MTTSRLLETRGFVSPRSLPRGPHGRALCRWCGREVPKGRLTFCGGERAWVRTRRYNRAERRWEPMLDVHEGTGCIHEHLVRSSRSYARTCVWIRDRGRCASCGRDCGGPEAGHAWQADHILPVVEGGGACGLENLRTLCTDCHKRETRALAGRLAAARRPQLLLPQTPEDRT